MTNSPARARPPAREQRNKCGGRGTMSVLVKPVQERDDEDMHCTVLCRNSLAVHGRGPTFAEEFILIPKQVMVYCEGVCMRKWV